MNLANWDLGALSGLAMGTIFKSNSHLSNINLANNQMGAEGSTAVVQGLQESQLKTLDLSRNGLQGGSGSGLDVLFASICSNLGLLTELRLDENELACDPNALAPLCKLRNLRTLSLEKNRLTQLPPLIGALLSLRRLLLFSNQLFEVRRNTKKTRQQATFLLWSRHVVRFHAEVQACALTMLLARHWLAAASGEPLPADQPRGP